MRVLRQWSIGTLAATIAGGIALAVPAGIVVAAIVAPGGQPTEPARRVVHAGPALLTVPPEWDRAAPFPGLEPDRTAVLSPWPGLPARVVVTFGPADDGSLLPADLRAVVDGPLLRPRKATLAGRPAVTYSAVRAHDLLLDVTVLPSTAGMLAVACAAPADSGQNPSECSSSITSISVPGATALAPSPAIPLASRLPAAIERLDRATVAGRAALRDARTPAAQARAADRLADRHVAAADSLRSAFGGASRPVAAALDRSARGYEALSAAALEGSALGFADAGDQVRLAEAALTTAVEEVLRQGRRPSTSTASTDHAVASTAGDSFWVRFAALLFFTLVLLGSLLTGFMSSGPVGGALTRATRRRSAPT
jgi:hypothetical protein